MFVLVVGLVESVPPGEELVAMVPVPPIIVVFCEELIVVLDKGVVELCCWLVLIPVPPIELPEPTLEPERID